MNWGTKLMIGLAVFIAFIIALGLMMVNSKSDDLVDPNYYEKEIKYDQDYNRKKQVVKDNAQPEIRITDTALNLKFVLPAVGKIKFVRTSDKKMDTSADVKSDAINEVSIPIQSLAKGSWRLLLEWKSEGKSYLYEKEIYLK